MKAFIGTNREWFLSENGVISAKNPVKTIAVVNSSLSSQNEDDANAKLMTAAPDLLEALQSIENDNGQIPKSIWELRNNAIKKALNKK